MELNEGSRIDRYVVQSVLGEGGMAVVYRVVHHRLGSPHAMKVLKLPTHAVQERLLQEGRLQARLRHPNIVAVTDVVDVRGAPGLVMELVEGPSLDRVLARGPLTRAQIDVVAQGVLTGVAAAHAAGLVHRDLKPSNILLAREGGQVVPKVTDFGVAKILEMEPTEGATRTGMSLGTPAYMSPEQIDSARTVDARSDVFAVGAVLYEMVSGERAFRGGSTLAVLNAVVEGRRRPIDELVPDLPMRMIDAIEGALEPDREARIPDAATLLGVWSGEGSFARDGIWDEDTLDRLDDVVAEPVILGRGSSTPVLEEVTTLPLEEQASRDRSTRTLLATLTVTVLVVLAAILGQRQLDPVEATVAPRLPLGVPRVEAPMLAPGPTLGLEPAPEPSPVPRKPVPLPPPDPPWIDVLSTPAGATVHVDGLEVGRTPLRGFEVPRGRHRIRLERGDAVVERRFGLGKRTTRRIHWNIQDDSWSDETLRSR